MPPTPSNVNALKRFPMSLGAHVWVAVLPVIVPIPIVWKLPPRSMVSFWLWALTTTSWVPVRNVASWLILAPVSMVAVARCSKNATATEPAIDAFFCPTALACDQMSTRLLSRPRLPSR